MGLCLSKEDHKRANHLAAVAGSPSAVEAGRERTPSDDLVLKPLPAGTGPREGRASTFSASGSDSDQGPKRRRTLTDIMLGRRSAGSRGSHEMAGTAATATAAAAAAAAVKEESTPAEAEEEEVVAPSVAPRGMVAGTGRVPKLAQRTNSTLGTLAIFISPLDVEAFTELDIRATQPAELPIYARGKALNRYYDILPNPLTMVRLTEEAKGPETTYVNANFVRGYDGRPREYIAAQGPTPATIYNFVRMLWEKSVGVIIMATNLKEGTKVKCERYWPETPESAALTFGNISVVLKRVTKAKGYVLNLLSISRGVESREIFHCWLNEWPDHGVPSHPDGSMDPSYVVSLLQVARATRESEDKCQGPMLIHCSAGIGRTGTLIVIDQCLQGLVQHHQVDLNLLIAQVREDRMGLVQHTGQYKFAYEACKSYAKTIASKERGEVFALSNTPRAKQTLKKDGSWKVHSLKNGEEMFALSEDGHKSLRTLETDKAVFAAAREEFAAQEAALADSPTARRKLEALPLRQQPWFRTNCTREQVEEVLCDAPLGVFLVRESSKPEHYALTVQQGNERVTMLITPVSTDQGVQYKLGQRADRRLFKSVVELVIFFTNNPYTRDESTGVSKVLVLRKAEVLENTEVEV